jgi:solute carrier family 29 (equilibrative nucleoside transporter), member 1/2/3
VQDDDIQNPLIEPSTHEDESALSNNSNNGNMTRTDEDSRVADTAALSWAKITEVYSQIRIPSMSVFFVFMVTIGIFPSLIVLLESENNCKDVHGDRFSNDLYVPFFFLLFNLFDLVGRITAGAIPPVFNAGNIWMGSVARLIFFPLFLFSNVSNSQLPVLFKSDAFPIIFMILMAFTNGYVASLSMMIGASTVAAKDAPIAGTIMVFSLTVGLFMGACTSFLTVVISQGSV